jgi:hypothetical protein
VGGANYRYYLGDFMFLESAVMGAGADNSELAGKSIYFEVSIAELLESAMAEAGLKTTTLLAPDSFLAKP